MNIDPKTLKILGSILAKLRDRNPAATVDDAIEILDRAAATKANRQMDQFQSIARNVKQPVPGQAQLEAKMAKKKLKEDIMGNGMNMAKLTQMMNMIKNDPELVKQAGQMIASLSKPGIQTSVTENKKYTITQNELVKCIKEGINLHEQKKFAAKYLSEQITEQKKVLKLTESYLKEGPLSNVFSAIKKGVGNVAQKFNNFKDPTKGGTYGQGGAGDTYGQDKTKDLQKFIAAAQKARQKFTQDTLKTTENLIAYHDAVVGAANTAREGGTRVPSDTPQTIELKRKMADEVRGLIGNLHQDLQGEKVNLVKFIANLEKDVPMAKSFGKEKALASKQQQAAEIKAGSSLRAGDKLAPQVKKGAQAAHLPGAKNTREFEKKFFGSDVNKFATTQAAAAKQAKKSAAPKLSLARQAVKAAKKAK